MGFSDQILTQKMALVIFPVACLLQIIGLSCPYWISVLATFERVFVKAHVKAHFGIWGRIFCYQGACLSIFLSEEQEWLKGVRALEILGLLAICTATVSTALSVFVASELTQKRCRIVAAMTAIVAVGMVLFGVIIFVIKEDADFARIRIRKETQYFDWAFALCIVAAMLSGLGGALTTMTLCLL